MQLTIDWSTSQDVSEDRDNILDSLFDAALDAGPVILLHHDSSRHALEPKLFTNVDWYLGNLALQSGELTGEWWAGVARNDPTITSATALAALYHLKLLLRRKTRRKHAPVTWAYDLPGPYDLTAPIQIRNEGENFGEIKARYPKMSEVMDLRPAPTA